jgi:hypothetical protein
VVFGGLGLIGLRRDLAVMRAQGELVRSTMAIAAACFWVVAAAGLLVLALSLLWPPLLIVMLFPVLLMVYFVRLCLRAVRRAPDGAWVLVGLLVTAGVLTGWAQAGGSTVRFALTASLFGVAVLLGTFAWAESPGSARARDRPGRQI